MKTFEWIGPLAWAVAFSACAQKVESPECIDGETRRCGGGVEGCSGVQTCEHAEWSPLCECGDLATPSPASESAAGTPDAPPLEPAAEPTMLAEAAAVEDPCLASCRAAEDSYALLDCASDFSSYLDCESSRPLECTPTGIALPAPRDGSCSTAIEGFDTCLGNGARNQAPDSSTAGGDPVGYDGVWTGTTADGWRVAFLVRSGSITQMVLFYRAASCVFPFGHRPPLAPVAIRGGSFATPVSLEAVGLLLTTESAPVATGTLSPDGTASGQLRDVIPAVVLCGGLSFIISSGNSVIEWTASWRAPLGNGSACAGSCAAQRAAACMPSAVPLALGEACASDADCAGGTCVALSSLTGIRACDMFDWDTFSCPSTRRPASNFGWSGGYCSPTCATDADCSLGSVKGGCSISIADAYLVHQVRHADLCAVACGAAGECPSGLKCVSDLNCAEPATDPTYGRCVPCP